VHSKLCQTVVLGIAFGVLSCGSENKFGVNAGSGGTAGRSVSLTGGASSTGGVRASTGGSRGGEAGGGRSAGTSGAAGNGGEASLNNGGGIGNSAGGAIASGGGASGNGGNVGTGGTVATGGAGSGGAGASGGAGTGGAIGTGGRVATGGAGTGGAIGTGGTVATGGAGTGGAIGTGGTVGAGGAGTGAAGTGGDGYYTWPVYSPTISYDYFDEYGTIPKPTTVADDCSGVAGTYTDTSGWWAFRYGANKNSLVTSAAWIPMVARFNTDFAYITDVMRWPRDSRARAGHYSAIYLYGSGLCTDTASNTATGGWQSWAGNDPIVLASYYPVYSFDPACPYSDKTYQQDAMVHEGIHCILSSMPGCKKSCWFQEGGNTWLQATMAMKRSGQTPTSMGWLSAGQALAPFMPIETYSGWLQDGSFGGPCAERVNMTNASGQQVCTWRKLLGGTQYGEAFPHALEVILGEKSVAWIWRYTDKSGRLLQDLAEVPSGLGVTQTRRLIQEFRGRQAFGDFGIWATAYKKLLDDNWKATIQAEWSPYWIDVPPWTASCYVASTQSGSTLTPEPTTLPGWSGANQIPLTLSAGATSATVTFTPTGANMSCQLVYRDTVGAIHYGAPVTSGACSIPTSNVKNNVVVAVIANTDYIYDGGTTKYGYSLTLGAGIAGKADIYTQWYK
jgi:hypothetical protein